jgi:transposase-like protein
MAKKHQSIFEVVSKFNTEEKCIKHLERIRWPKGLQCPHCEGKRIMTFTVERKTGKEASLYECIECHYQYSVTAGTIFHDSHLPLVKWFLAIYMICSAKKGIPATQLQRELEIGSYKTAWYMAHRIRLAMRDDPQFCQKYSGVVEIDETYIGGKRSGLGARGTASKIPVVGMKERTSGKIRLKAIQDASKRTLSDFIRKNVEPGSEMHTDEFASYFWLDSSEFAHKSVNHSKSYVSREGVHVNGVENVWSLFKRGIMGVFHKVSEKYLPLYLDEFSFRFNNRDAENMMDRVLTTCS